MKALKLCFISIILLTVLLSASKGQEGNSYTERKLRCSMAGSGDPWSALTKSRRPILMAMHDGLNIKQLAKVFSMSEEQMINEINHLKESSLVKVYNNNYAPDFFISDSNETKKVYSHSKTIGKILADALLEDWDILEHSYSELSFSKSYSLKEQGFMFVGSRILDMGVLGALVRDKCLLTIAPSRPSPTRPDGQYYFWMVEGKFEHLGKYGQDDTGLKWASWHVLNFGQSVINGEFNQKREDFENKIAEIIESDTTDSPDKFANTLDIPFLSKEDSKIWEEVSRQISSKLLIILKEQKSDIIKFYNTLKTSTYTNNSFGEFFCWYYHLAYAWAIDALQTKGAIIIPPERFSGLVMYREGPEGLLSK